MTDTAIFGKTIKPTYGLKVGVSSGGYLRLAQEMPFENESVILLCPNEVRLLIEILQEHADGDWWTSFEGDSNE